MRSPSLGVALTLLLVPTAAATDIEPGFSETPLNFSPALLAATATLANGQVLSFDGIAIERYTSNGLLVQTYTTLPQFVFPSFVLVSPNETFAVVGESSFGDLFRVDLGSGNVTTIATLDFNYDAVIDAAGDLFVSAGASTPGMNGLYRVDLTSGAVDPVAEVPGFSGPLALRPNGDLLMALADTPDRIISYTPLQLAGGSLLSEADATPVSIGWNGISDMVVDRERNQIYVVENDFVNGVDPSMIVEVRPSKANSRVVATAGINETFGTLEMTVDAGDPEVFAPFQPSTGGRMRFSNTDFSSFAIRSSIRPERPTSSVSGPGVLGTGIVDYEVTGALPNAAMWVFFGPSVLYDPSEPPIPLGTAPPLFWGLHLGTQKFIPFLIPTDANGTGRFSFFNTGVLNGILALQSPIADPSANLLGSATGSTL